MVVQSWMHIPDKDKRYSSEAQLERMAYEKLLNWKSLWYHLVELNSEKNVSNFQTEAKISQSRHNVELCKKIKSKLHELVNEQEILANLYMKAAETARNKVHFFERKAENMMKQIEKDIRFLNKHPYLFYRR